MNRFCRLPMLASACALALSLGFTPGTAQAAVEKIEILERKPVAEGKAFGNVGAYELVKGRLHYAIRPGDTANAPIVDLNKAPRDARGLVTFSADFALIRPVEAEAGNGTLLYEVNNRGNLYLFNQFDAAPLKNDLDAADALGDGLLLEQGYSLLWSAWNWDVQPGGGRQLISLPVATDHGRTITGPVHYEFSVAAPARTSGFVGTLAFGYAPATAGAPDAVLTVRDTPTGAKTVIARDSWRFGKPDGDTIADDPTSVVVTGGLIPGKLYELSYTAKDPRVVGLGLAAIRDALSFFRYDKADSAGTENPLSESQARRVLAFGISQSGRVIQTLLQDGLHVDEKKRATFDGAFIHAAGSGKGGFNFRFAQTTRHFSAFDETSYPTDYFPFATTPQKDPVTRRTAGVLDKAKAAHVVPRLIYTNSSTDYWGRSASLLHTDPTGLEDAPVDPNVRIYALNGAQHLVLKPADRNIYENCFSAVDYRPSLRALLAGLDRWVATGQEPPRSRYPNIASGSLTTIEGYRLGFPAIPGIRVPDTYLVPRALDLGEGFAATGIPTKAPPVYGYAYGTRLPATDTDGNDIGGIRQVEVAAPLGTYTGWNLRTGRAGSPEAIGRYFGSFLPFARTEAERVAAGDPRPSLEERYGSRDGYAAKAEAAARDLVGQGFLRPQDAKAVVDGALAFYDRILKREASDTSCRYLAG